jgi:hypothetical protein
MPDDERYEDVVRAALGRKADGAPSMHGLADLVRTRLARRRRRRVAGAAAACLAVIASVVAVTQGTGSDDDPGRPDTVHRPDRPAPVRIHKPDGWRWESYGGIEVAVPHWGYGTTGQPPCLMPRDFGPYVGRPGAVRSIGCTEALPALARREPYVWFDSTEPIGVRTYDRGWVTDTRTIGGVRITVLAADAELRRQIFGTAHVVDRIDSYGCPVDHPIAADPHGQLRPYPQDGGLATVGIVRSASVCRYRLIYADSIAPMPRPLIASDRAGLAAFKHTLLSAPEGGGPNSPQHCLPEVAYGDEAIVLIVRGDRHDQEVFVRYAGCDGHGFDDGMTHRELTGDLLWSLTMSTRTPHQLMQISDPAVADLMPLF